MPGSSEGDSTNAPAPSANRMAVDRSFQSVMRDKVSAPTTSARFASPQRTYLSAIDSAYMNPAHAVSTLNAGLPRQPSRCWSNVPQLGNTRSDVLVPKARRLDRTARRMLSEIDRRFAVGGDMAALDPGSGTDPLVGGLHQL